MSNNPTIAPPPLPYPTTVYALTESETILHVLELYTKAGLGNRPSSLLLSPLWEATLGLCFRCYLGGPQKLCEPVNSWRQGWSDFSTETVDHIEWKETGEYALTQHETLSCVMCFFSRKKWHFTHVQYGSLCQFYPLRVPVLPSKGIHPLIKFN